MTAPPAAPPDRWAAPDATAPPVLQRRLFLPTTAVFGLIAALFAVGDPLGLRVPEAVQAIPFAASVLLFGLPHGALDHLVPARLDPRITRARSIAVVVAVYALLGGATFAVWVAAPPVGFALFIAVTWFHWGQGDLWLDRALLGTAPGRVDAALTVLVRGGLPMLVPLIAHPADYAAVFRATTGLLGAHGGDVDAVLGSVAVRAAAALVLAAALVAHLAVRRRSGAALAATSVELAALAAFFLAVPPVLAVGLYFTFWHAVRHIVRLELLTEDGRRALEHGRLLAPFVRFLRDALPVTACAVALLAGLALAVHDAGLGTYLVLIAALTTPHTAIVTWMDRRRRTPGRAATIARAEARDPAALTASPSTRFRSRPQPDPPRRPRPQRPPSARGGAA